MEIIFTSDKIYNFLSTQDNKLVGRINRALGLLEKYGKKGNKIPKREIEYARIVYDKLRDI